MRTLFERVRKHGLMATETAWRLLNAEGATWGQWEVARNVAGEVNLTIFVAVSAALIPLADAQVKRFEKVEAELKSEARLGAMRRGVAARREKKAERLKGRPEAVRKYLENQQRNREARGGVKPAPTREEVVRNSLKALQPPKKPVARDGHGDAIGRTRAGAKRKGGK